MLKRLLLHLATYPYTSLLERRVVFSLPEVKHSFLITNSLQMPDLDDSNGTHSSHQAAQAAIFPGTR